MIREIKFRAWNGYKMCRVEMIDFDSNYLKQYIVMQYTGLNDKNGTEIYEGDILRRIYRNEVMVVEYSKSQALYLMRLKDNMSYTFFDISDYYVIGNIYENPELLEANE